MGSSTITGKIFHRPFQDRERMTLLDTTYTRLEATRVYRETPVFGREAVAPMLVRMVGARRRRSANGGSPNGSVVNSLLQ